MDDESVRSPTSSELKTFRVLANLDFTDFGKQEMKSPEQKLMTGPQEGPEVHETKHESESVRSWKEDRDEKRESDVPVVPDVRDETDLRDVPEVRERRPDTPDNLSEAHPEERAEDRGDSKDPKEEPSEEYKKAKADTEADIALEKEALLYELELMDKQGVIKLHRHLTMNDSLEAIQYQYDRANMISSTNQTVDWAKMGIKMGSGVLENVLKQFGLTMVDGFSKNLCQDMNKFNKPLTKMYRKYWRRGTSSPEMELAMIVFGALAMTVITNKGFLGGASAKPKPAATEPFARPSPPESALRPPQMSAQAPASAPSIPDWAKAALAAPAPQAPAHFAQVAPPPPNVQTVAAPATNQWPEIARPLQIPPIAAPVSALSRPEARQEPRPEARHEDSRSEEQGLRVISLSSPKSSRRRKEPVQELNLDAM